MVESEIGDNTLLLCKSCDFAANVEKADCKPDFSLRLSVELAVAAAASTPSIEKIDTPNVKTIEELCSFLKTDAKIFIKTLVYRAVKVELQGAECDEAFYAVCIRGDLEINEAKLCALLKAAEVSLAGEADVVRLTGAPVGFAGPVGLSQLKVVADFTVTAITDGVTGALAKDLHYKHVAYGRDFQAWMTADVRTVKAGDRCSLCGGELYEKKGNELGHIFKLGYKYTKSMNVGYLDEKGVRQIPLSGSYGIGLDRTLASIIEEHHDDAGIIWPLTVAPYHVIIVPIKYDGAVKTAADKLAEDLERQGIEVLLDDRDERPGVKFNDADLIGIPYRVVIGDKNLAGESPKAELKRRNEKDSRLVELGKIAGKLKEEIQAELAKLNKA
jgi:prolyl-tRNA synthetase